MKKLACRLVVLFLLTSTTALGEVIDVTEDLTHMECRARGGDGDPYYFETKEKPRNPGDPTGTLSLVWSYNSIFNSKPISYFEIDSVQFDTNASTYTLTFHFAEQEDRIGTLVFENGGGGEADFYNRHGDAVYETLSRCRITGKW